MKFRHRAFSLIELLVVIAIVAVIAAILLPVLSRSKQEAQRTSDLSKFQQLGLAANLYREQYDKWPRGASQLVETKLIPPEICAFAADPTPEGLANRVGRAMGNLRGFARPDLVMPYRNSGIGQREYRVAEDLSKQWVQPEPSGGWLVDFSAANFNTNEEHAGNLALSTGKYRRLCYSGTVLTRAFRKFDLSDGQGVPVISFYVDPNQEMQEWLRSR